MDTPPSIIRVLVVDDSALVRQLLKTIIDAQADMQCVGVARHAEAALAMRGALRPDVMTLDVEMPHISGLQLLEHLMQHAPLPVVMISSQTREGAETTLRALEIGAVDFVAKPLIGVADGLQQLAQSLVEKIRTAAVARPMWCGGEPQPANDEQATAADAIESPHAARRPSAAPVMQPLAGSSLARGSHRPLAFESRAHGARAGVRHVGAAGVGRLSQEAGEPPRAEGLRPEVIVMGASTGGTDAIRTILQRLADTMPPILIVQHMPPGFTRTFAARLDADSHLTVREAKAGELLRSGHAYIAPGGRHLRVRKVACGYVAIVDDDAPVMHHRPSVDVLFRSALGATAGRAIGVLLTGMGGDGAAALLALREAGAYTIAQDAATCVVYGMPREAAQLGAAMAVLPLCAIADELAKCSAAG